MKDSPRIVVDTYKATLAAGLNQGSAGNVSCRRFSSHLDVEAAKMWITPSGISIDRLSVDDIVQVNLKTGSSIGHRKPSSEWPFHQAIYREHSKIGAIVHAHSPYATALACLGRDLPSFHYMVAMAGGENIRCAKYETYGTPALSDAVLAAMDGRKACLIANHGMVAGGSSLQEALDLAIEIETLCQQYLLALQVGTPELLSSHEMATVIEKFKDYK